MIVDDYIEYCKKYQATYGENCAVLIQVGDFFEQYRTDTDGANIHKICDICNLQVSRKNKNILEVSRSNPLMCGFPLSALPKYVQILLQKDYTIVLVKQITAPPDVKRDVTEILSPSTVFGSTESNYLMVLYFDLGQLGVGIVDVTTGRSFAYETGVGAGGAGAGAGGGDEAVRLVQTYNPSELVLIGASDAERDLFRGRKFLERGVEKWSINYQNAIIGRVFSIDGVMSLSPLEVVGLERWPTAGLAYCHTLQFVHEHNEQILFKMQKPEILDNRDYLTLHYNAAVQLNLIGGERPLLGILNKCATAFGSRLFKERLLMPIQDVAELERRYAAVEDMAVGRRYAGVMKEMSFIMDIERVVRKIVLGTFQPADWAAFDSSLDAAGRVLGGVGVGGIQKAYRNILDLDEASKHLIGDIKGNFFKRGLYTDIDDLQDTIARGFDEFKATAAIISAKGECRMDCNERDGYYLTMTKKRFDAVKDFAGVKALGLVARSVSTSSTILKITNAGLDTISDRILSGQRRLGALVSEKYRGFLRNFGERWCDALTGIVGELAQIDVAATSAMVAADFKYCRPRPLALEGGGGGTAYIDAKNMRHPIIERLHQRIAYKANDIEIGRGDSGSGMLLYGINASGKSSLMKAIGLNVILAQAGMFVPCDSFEFSPYQHIFTRIAEGDNIYRGQSSFTVEMTELRNILMRANRNSLVLGDELCAGTEAVSAISIVAAGVDMLSRMKTCFVFATHLHELTNIRVVREAPGLRICHMHVEIDADNRIVYDRQLREGSGSAIYGLEVCRALQLPADFLAVANAVRQEVQNVPKAIVSPQRSRYNGGVLMAACSLCGGAATETHHIRQQKDADDNGFIGHIHKDMPSNLAPLCEACHLKQHVGGEAIRGYVETSEGVKVVMGAKAGKAGAGAREPEDIEKLRKHLCYGIGGWKMRPSGRGRWMPGTTAGIDKLTKIDPESLKELLFDSSG